MLLSALARAAGGFGYSRPLRSLANTHRTLFYPSAPPPSPDSIRRGEFPSETRAHISEEQFSLVRQASGNPAFPNDVYSGIVDVEDQQKVIIGGTPAERWEQLGIQGVDGLPPSVHQGRTVLVRHNEGVGQAYFKLQGILRTNNVRTELRLAERHEKKGAKRRRLRSERWRRKFADEVRKKVRLVTEIRLRDRMWGARH